jgi:hypothetical protein
MSLDAGFQTKLASLTDAPVQQNYASIDQVQPRVWYQRESGQTELFLDASAGMAETVYTVEVHGTDPDAAGAIADLIQVRLHGFTGFMGTTRILGSFVEDAADEYEPRGLNVDDGYHVFAFKVRVLA